MTPRTTERPESGQGGLLSIGALSAATGIPVDTIRTWERRYGFPVAQRKPSGHRVYALSTVPRLQRVAQAIAQGHRAAEVLTASESALEALLATLPHALDKTPSPRTPGSATRGALHDSAELLDAVRAFDADRLKRAFQADWARLGPLEFLEGRAAPFLTAVGDAWEKGTLDVRHEHFGSAVLGDFLRAVRLPLEDRASGPVVALATLPGELHGLGLQMSALVFSLAGWRPLLLGVDTPVAQIVALTKEAPIGAVALSCVQPGGSAASAIRELRQRVPRRTPIIVGGAGAPDAARDAGVEVIPDLTALDRWVRGQSTLGA
ncbi:MAG TPA: cobalamin B12-binding domain-containing protein [Gemmatimonadaceae bacterium]|nr:cobalamin B12-binding domain-containing protein [Gemmatimonadaceae bacterium]